MQGPFEGISLNVALLFCRGILNERAFPLRSHDPSLRETLFIQFLHEPWLDLIHRQGLNWEVFLLIFFPLSLIWSLLHSFAISTRNKLPLRSDSSYKRWVPFSSSSFNSKVQYEFDNSLPDAPDGAFKTILKGTLRSQVISLLRRGSSVRYINPLCEVYRRRKVEWIDQFSIRRRTSARCMSISRTSLSFSRTSMDFSTLAKFDSLKLTETHC